VSPRCSPTFRLVPSRWFNAGILGHYRAYHEALILILIVLLISSISYLAWMANSHVLHHVPLRDREWIRWELDDGSDRRKSRTPGLS
jgi:hypothetical protein